MSTVNKTDSVYKKRIYLDSTREAWPGIPFNVATIVRKTDSVYIKRTHLDSTREIQSKIWSDNHHGKQRKSIQTHTILHTEVHKPRDSLDVTATKALLSLSLLYNVTWERPIRVRNLKSETRKFAGFCLVLITSVLLNLSCVWILFYNASSHSCFRNLKSLCLFFSFPP